MGQLKPLLTDMRRANGTGRSIYERLRAQIANGSLPAGACAPSTRSLAAELGVSRTTVTTAYEQLAAEGYLVTAKGRVARIARPMAAAETSGLSGIHQTGAQTIQFRVPRPGYRIVGTATDQFGSV